MLLDKLEEIQTNPGLYFSFRYKNVHICITFRKNRKKKYAVVSDYYIRPIYRTNTLVPTGRYTIYEAVELQDAVSRYREEIRAFIEEEFPQDVQLSLRIN